MERPVALVGLALGGPDDPEGVEPVVRQILADPEAAPLPGWRLARILASRSALQRAARIRLQFDDLRGVPPSAWALDLTTRVALELEGTLRGDAGPVPLRPFRALRYGAPGAAEAIREIEAQGIREAILLPLTPYGGPAGAGAGLVAFREAAAAAGDPFTYSIVDPWYAHPAWLDTLAAEVNTVLAGFPEALGQEAAVLCTTLGLPRRALRRVDGHADQVAATVAGLKARLPESLALETVHHGWLRRCAGPGPALASRLRALGREERRAVLTVPLTQTGPDPLTAFELGLEAADVARAAGVPVYRRAAPLDGDPRMVLALARILRDHLARRPGGRRLTGAL